ncbi:MAG: ATP-binding cassette domain-containing protein [Actinobacteria bacterium]|nr:ATP-binding cassette domain-containing protein [Actinomycetota bacterium]
MSDAVIIKNLRVIRDKKIIIPDLTLSINTGVIIGLLGPSGSGKTSIFRSIVGVQKISGGSISVLGESAGSKADVSEVVDLVGLDPILRIELWKIFNQLAERGKTLIISSHVIDEADRCKKSSLAKALSWQTSQSSWCF